MRKLKVSALLVACLALASASMPVHAAQDEKQAPFERLCSDPGGRSPEGKFADWLAERLNLNDTQKAALKEFHDARAKALADSKAKLCANKPDLSSFEARLVFGQTFHEARLEALKLENPKLIAFYNSLDDRQKKKFEKIREHLNRH